MIQREMILTQPAPFPSCHASTLVHLGGEDYLVAWFGGTREKNPDTGIWCASRVAGRWESPRLLAKVAPVAHWNPVLFAPPGGLVHVFFKVSPTIPDWRTWTATSGDGGRTWTVPRLLCDDAVLPRGPVKNKPIILVDGTWLAPASQESIHGERRVRDAFVDRSEDGGRTWTASPLVPIDHDSFAGSGIIQPTLWESAPGKVHMLVRTKAVGRVGRSDSADGGRTWSPLELLDVPHNNSGLDLARLADGTLVLAHNPVTQGRTPLSLSVSHDNGWTWRRAMDLETSEGHEYSYPAIIATGPTSLALCYTWRRQQIAFATLDQADLDA